MLTRRFFDRFKKKESLKNRDDLGILVFENTSEVIQAERVLKKGGWPVRVMGPPPGLQTGCDLVIEFPLMERLHLQRLLTAVGIPPLEMVPVTDPLLKPVDLFHTKDFGLFLLVRAANMKITVEKKSLLIVNISGGGCPDVPYLASLMVGKTIYNTPRPCTMGHTLCGYALELALQEVERQCLP
jgi:hypothetical protein